MSFVFKTNKFMTRFSTKKRLFSLIKTKPNRPQKA